MPLQRVNLLIGPNNSGKSNFLKAIKFWGKPYVSQSIIYKNDKENDSIVKIDVKSTEKVNISAIYHKKDDTTGRYVDVLKNRIDSVIFPLYSIDISKIKQEAEAQPNIYVLNDDCSNIVSFLDNMRDERKDIITKIEQDLKQCVKEFESISFKKTKNGDKYTYKKVGLTTEQGETYWAEDLSDGTLYFLALLCIVNQPTPPKTLLLEEPENGIHPRRIKEMLDYIFDLAEDKDIQVVMTTHNTYVIDQFKDIPESVFVFDKKGDETTVRCLQDIINEDAKIAAKDGMPKMDLSGSLGDHWASGLIGGVPL
jgi:predicted ATPase